MDKCLCRYEIHRRAMRKRLFDRTHVYVCQFSVVLHIAKFRISHIPDYTSSNDQSTQINSITQQNQSYE